MIIKQALELLAGDDWLIQDKDKSNTKFPKL